MTAQATNAGRQPRVLTFLHSFEPGGVERVALRLHRAWVDEGADARLVMGRLDGAMRAEWPGLEPDVFGSRGIDTGPLETLWMILRLPGAIRRHRPDVLFCAGNSYTVVAVAMKLLLGRRCPPIMAKVSNDLLRLDLPAFAMPFYRIWLRMQGRFIDRLVAIAPAMVDEIVELMAVPLERVAVIENPAMTGEELDRLAGTPRAPHNGGRRFLAVGRLAAQKNFTGLVDAFARIARHDDRLTICGEGGQRAAIEARARRLGVADRVLLPGHTHPLDAPLAEADALVLSSDYEGLPSVVLEAYAAGLPVVATDCSASMASLLGHGRFGLLVPPGDVGALATAMDRIADHPFDPELARDEARRFTVDLAARRYLQAMEDLVPCSTPCAP
ncbi:glycosyltransferase [Novosphingobium sp. KCTC 2891]|uniref:glycosyltransferase n=1 Tax=Novosphingobium sp. KCTC 2891 TaxID=2989730 RepID=UPI002222C58D|nr:glycosyltransferase [Novosphingobium sp. KCTC 2891]MCW1381385.1 glycosyltransferase [Novosphingobium sp. KCTC 2891]